MMKNFLKCSGKRVVRGSSYGYGGFGRRGDQMIDGGGSSSSSVEGRSFLRSCDSDVVVTNNIALFGYGRNSVGERYFSKRVGFGGLLEDQRKNDDLKKKEQIPKGEGEKDKGSVGAHSRSKNDKPLLNLATHQQNLDMLFIMLDKVVYMLLKNHSNVSDSGKQWDVNEKTNVYSERVEEYSISQSRKKQIDEAISSFLSNKTTNTSDNNLYEMKYCLENCLSMFETNRHHVKGIYAVKTKKITKSAYEDEKLMKMTSEEYANKKDDIVEYIYEERELPLILPECLALLGMIKLKLNQTIPALALMDHSVRLMKKDMYISKHTIRKRKLQIHTTVLTHIVCNESREYLHKRLELKERVSNALSEILNDLKAEYASMHTSTINTSALENFESDKKETEKEEVSETTEQSTRETDTNLNEENMEKEDVEETELEKDLDEVEVEEEIVEEPVENIERVEKEEENDVAHTNDKDHSNVEQYGSIQEEAAEKNVFYWREPRELISLVCRISFIENQIHTDDKDHRLWAEVKRYISRFKKRKSENHLTNTQLELQWNDLFQSCELYFEFFYAEKNYRDANLSSCVEHCTASIQKLLTLEFIASEHPPLRSVFAGNLYMLVSSCYYKKNIEVAARLLNEYQHQLSTIKTKMDKYCDGEGLDGDRKYNMKSTCLTYEIILNIFQAIAQRNNKEIQSSKEFMKNAWNELEQLKELKKNEAPKDSSFVRYSKELDPDIVYIEHILCTVYGSHLALIDKEYQEAEMYLVRAIDKSTQLISEFPSSTFHSCDQLRVFSPSFINFQLIELCRIPRRESMIAKAELTEIKSKEVIMDDRMQYTAYCYLKHLVEKEETNSKDLEHHEIYIEHLQQIGYPLFDYIGNKTRMDDKTRKEALTAFDKKKELCKYPNSLIFV